MNCPPQNTAKHRDKSAIAPKLEDSTFSDESRFTLKFADGRIRVWRWPDERFAAACVMPVDRFSGSQLLLWEECIAQERPT